MAALCPRWWLRSIPVWWIGWYCSFLCGPMKLGRCYPADVIDMDPIGEIKAYPGPVLIIHGTRDGIVKLEYSQQAQQAYPNARLHIIEGGAHGFSKKHDAIAMAHLRRFAGRNEK